MNYEKFIESCRSKAAAALNKRLLDQAISEEEQSDSTSHSYKPFFVEVSILILDNIFKDIAKKLYPVFGKGIDAALGEKLADFLHSECELFASLFMEAELKQSRLEEAFDRLPQSVSDALENPMALEEGEGFQIEPENVPVDFPLYWEWINQAREAIRVRDPEGNLGDFGD